MSRLSPLALTRKWRHLRWDERVGFVQAALAVPGMALSLRVFGFNRVRQWVERTTATRGGRQWVSDDVVRISVISVNRVKRYSLFGGNCLSQSLTLAWMMRRRGLAPALRLGVSLRASQLDAHAWIEYEGRVLNDTQDVHTRFTPFIEKSGAR